MNWYYFFIWYCTRRPPHWKPSFVKGPEYRSENDARRYADDLTYQSGGTETPLIVNSWRYENGQWRDLGWSSAQACGPLTS